MQGLLDFGKEALPRFALQEFAIHWRHIARRDAVDDFAPAFGF
jgi:hypothetical protein